MIKVVLDTNIVCASISLGSPFRKVLDSFEKEEYCVVVSTSIMLEYFEKLDHFFGEKVAHDFTEALRLNSKVDLINPSFSFNLLSNDPDDNKFVDCYLNSEANYLVTNDKDYNPLKKIEYPKLNIISIEEFKEML